MAKRRTNLTQKPPAPQAEREWLIKPGLDLRSGIPFCPTAKTLTFWSGALDSQVLVVVRCRRWGCEHCGRRRVRHIAARVADAKPTRLVTLTVNPQFWGSPREAYLGTTRAVSDLTVKLRRRLGEWSYCRVLEVTKKGWPHYHLMVRSPYVQQAVLSELWGGMTGAPIVDVRQIKQTAHTYWYVVKYLGKQRYIPWTNRRLAWSRDFFPPQRKQKLNRLELCSKDFHMEHPADWMQAARQGWSVRHLLGDMFQIVPPRSHTRWWLDHKPENFTAEADVYHPEESTATEKAAQGDF